MNWTDGNKAVPQPGDRSGKGVRGPSIPESRMSTFGALLERTAQLHSARPAVATETSRLTYLELLALVDRVAWGLYKIGIRRGDHVAVWMPNSLEWLTLEFAITKLGGVVVPINTRYTTQEAEWVLRQSDARVLIMAERFRGRHLEDSLIEMCPEVLDARRGQLRSERLPRLQLIVKVGSTARMRGVIPYESLKIQAPNRRILRAAERLTSVDDIALIMYTSGTTARPKGVMLTHGQITQNMYEARVLQEELESSDRLLVVVPFFHVAGALNSVFGMLHVGGCLVIRDHFDPELVLKTIEAERVTRFYGVTTMFVDLLESPSLGRYDTSSLRRAHIFPGPLSVGFLADTLARLRIGSGISMGYGLTETTNGVTFVASWRDGLQRMATGVGRPRDGYELAVFDPASRSAAVSAGTTGEICVRGFVVTKGYYGDAAETKRAIDDEGWLHTGDLGMIDDDGSLVFHGRLKEMLKVSGFNVSCQEVETTLLQHEAVIRVALIGVPDSRTTEAGVAFVQKRPGSVCTESELTKFCRNRLAGFKVPRHIRFIEEMPVNASGKAQKTTLQALWQETTKANGRDG